MRKALYILGNLLDTDLIWLAKAGEIRQIPAGQVLIEEDREIEEMFIVTEGKFAIRAGGRQVAEFGVGDILGEMSFVEKRLPSATVTATGAARVLAVPRERLLDEFRDNDAFAARFYRALAVFLSDRLRSMMPDDDEELDEGLLDSLHVAGDRMIRLIDLLETEAQPA